MRMAYAKKTGNNQSWQNVMNKKPSFTIGGNVVWLSLYGKQYGDISKKINKSD